jgi:hypothetical protein
MVSPFCSLRLPSNLPLTVYGFPIQESTFSVRGSEGNWGEMHWESSSQMFESLCLGVLRYHLKYTIEAVSKSSHQQTFSSEVYYKPHCNPASCSSTLKSCVQINITITSFYLFFCGNMQFLLVTLRRCQQLDCITSNGGIKNESWTWKDVEGNGRGSIEVPSRHLPEDTDESNNKLQSRETVTRPGFEWSTSWLLVKSITATPTCSVCGYEIRFVTIDEEQRFCLRTGDQENTWYRGNCRKMHGEKSIICSLL